jgi:hypothetical protein
VLLPRRDDELDAVIDLYTAPTCAGPETLVATLTPDATTNAYEYVGPYPADAGAVLLQALPTAGLGGTSEFSERLVIDGIATAP